MRQEIVEALSGPSGPSQAILAKANEFTRLICNPSPHRRSRHGNNSKPESYLKIFAILVLIERVSSIGDFIKEGVDDSALPLRRVEVKSARVPRFELRPRPQDSSRLACLRRWNQVQLMQFDDWQWTVMAPFFSRAVDGKVMRYRFPDSTILPFSKEKRQPGDLLEEQEFEGGFGKVSKVHIHPEHHNFYDGKVCLPHSIPQCLSILTTRSQTTLPLLSKSSSQEVWKNTSPSSTCSPHSPRRRILTWSL